MIDSPCIKQCDLDTSKICKGCYRNLDEIKLWSTAQDHERKAILRKAFHRKFAKINHKIDNIN